MDRKNQRNSQRMIFAVVGAALAVPLMAAPASAAMDSGNFQMRAVDSDNTKITSTAGAKVEAPVETPAENGDTSPAVASYQCGPLGYTVTQSMVDLQEANQKAQAEGRTGDIKASADGWKSIWTYSYSDSSSGFTPGLPKAGASGTNLIYFSKTMDTPQLIDVYFGTPASTSLKILAGTGTDCSITDLTAAPQEGNSYSYTISAGSYTEGRYLSQDGELQAVTSRVDTTNGIRTVERHSATNVAKYIESSKTPSAVTRYDTGLVSLEFTLGETIDGYNHITVTKLADGSQSVSYSLLNESTNKVSTAVRSHGPSTLNIDSTGKITKVTYINGSGTEVAVPNPTVAQYNTATGQDWDGSYPKFSDFDSSIPFEATKS